MTIQAEKVLAIPALAPEQAGAITYWTLQVNGGIDFDKLCATWLAAGLPADALPPAVSPATALRAAVRAVEEARLFASPTPERDGWVLTDETPKADHDAPLSYQIRTVVRISAEGSLQVSGDEVLGQRVREEYARQRGIIGSARLGGWLVDRARNHGAVALRDTGGVYFVPRNEVAGFSAEANAVRQIGAVVFQIPALRGDEAVEAVVAALNTEADAALADIERELLEGKLGDRALKSRQDACEKLLKKVRTYEGACETSLKALTERVERLAADVAAAALADPEGVFAGV